jgi:hypothetical protein
VAAVAIASQKPNNKKKKINKIKSGLKYERIS